MDTNADLQVQLAKAGGAHGQACQVRVEKDTLMDRLRYTEGEQDQLRVQLEDLQAVRDSRGRSRTRRLRLLREQWNRGLHWRMHWSVSVVCV